MQRAIICVCVRQATQRMQLNYGLAIAALVAAVAADAAAAGKNQMHISTMVDSQF